MTASSASASAPAPVPLAIARSMLSLGIDASRAFAIASASAGLPSGSPPPSFAATVIARVSLVKSLPRRESTTAFLCLIEAHLECPDMRVSLTAGGLVQPLIGGRAALSGEVLGACAAGVSVGFRHGSFQRRGQLRGGVAVGSHAHGPAGG